MCKNRFLTVLMLVVALFVSSVTVPTAGFSAPLGVNVQISGYLPTPPGVSILIDSGRPYYVERDRRVYVQRDPKYKHYKKKHYKPHHRGHDRGRSHSKH